MPRSKRFIGRFLLIFMSYGARWGRAAPTLLSWCSKLNSTLTTDDPLRLMCQYLRAAIEVELPDDSDCVQALNSASAEHLLLLAYSSGNYLETLYILAGAGLLNDEEDIEFLSRLHLNNRGLPSACKDIDDAHYCIAQPVVVVSVGLCVPRSCDSSELMRLLGYTRGSSPRTESIVGIDPDENRPQDAFPSVVCGDESSLSIDVGTICTIVAIGCLIILVASGTLLDYWNQCERDAFMRKQDGQDGVRTTPTGESHQLVPKPKSSTSPDAKAVVRNPAACGDRGDTGAQVPIRDVGSSLGAGRQDEDLEHEEKEKESPTPGTEDVESHRAIEGRFLGTGEDSAREPLLGSRATPRRGLRGRFRALSRLVLKAEAQEAWWSTCLKCFSLRVNLEKLFSPPRSPNTFRALDGVRCFSMMWVILGHVLVFPLGGAGLTNMIDVLPMDGHGFITRFTAQVFPAAAFAVDSFFLMSGFLLSVALLRRQKRTSLGNGLEILKIYLHRYLRLTPMVLVVTLIRWQLFPFISEGPTWWPAAARQKEQCGKYWWGEILYISNLFPWPPNSGMCNAITWYLGNDMQFFLVGVPVVATYSYRPRVVIVFLLSLMVASFACVFWLSIREDLSFSLVVSASSRSFWIVYSTPWCRCPVYIIGVLAGMGWTKYVEGHGILPHERPGPGRHDSNQHGVSKRRRYIVAGAIVASALLLALPAYGSYGGYQDASDVRMPAWLDHLYLTFSRPAWALGLALMSGLCFCGYGGFVNTILTLPLWATLSQLTFGMYLTHTLLIDWVTLSSDAARDFTVASLSVTFMGTLMGTAALAFVLHMVVEAPFRNLASLMKRRRANAPASN